MAKIRVPRAFIDDHYERDLPTPDLTDAGRQYIIDTDAPELPELIDDAKHYALDGTDAPRSVVAAAKRLLARLCHVAV